MAGGSGISKNSLEKYVIDSNEALELKMIRTPEDLDDDQLAFKPEMSHQVYGDSEQIFGYLGLRIKLYYSAGRLTTYLSHIFDEKINPSKFDGVQPDEVIKPLAEKIPEGFHVNVSDFTAALKKESSFKPFGEMKYRFTAVSEKGEDRVYEIYLCDITCPGFLEYHDRLQTFILWYIDAASFIDSDDDKWRFFLVYEKYMLDGNPQFALAGFTTVYEYYAYPANTRPRISQMLVLPPFQRMGIGAQMLNTIYQHFNTMSEVIDITVEDPSENFARVRDFVDCKNCLKLDAFQPDKLTQGFSDEMIKVGREKFKLNKRQVRRVYEILRLHITDRSKKEEYRKYRLDIKNRLNIQYKKEDRDMKKLEKIFQPEEVAATMTFTSKEQRIENLERQYTELEEHYCQVLERLASASLS